MFRRAVDLIDLGDVEGLRAHLQENPNLTRQHVVFEGGNYFRNPTLIGFVAENPVRRGKLPANIVEVTHVILEAGVEQTALDEALGLVATGCVPRQCGVQTDLIDLLCERGADPRKGIKAAAAQGEMEAVHALSRRGGEMTPPVAAALGDNIAARRLLPGAEADGRHLALAFAAQFGHAEIVRLLLDAGEDPNRFNPVGAHSHSTPLHQAAGNGHLEVVRLLIQEGAKLETWDILWDGTPAGWANHAGKKDVEEYLRSMEKAASL